MSEKLDKQQQIQLEVLREVYHAKIAIVAACYNKQYVNKLIYHVCHRVQEEQGSIKGMAWLQNDGKWADNSSIDGSRWDLFQNLPESEEHAEYMRAFEKVRTIEFMQERGGLSWNLSKGLSIYYVPGVFEIPQAARLLASRGQCDAIIAIGCAIRGRTYHFQAISKACTEGLNRVAQDFTMPVAHGVFLLDGGEDGRLRNEAYYEHRGGETASAAIQMLRLAAEVDININIAMRESE